MSDTGAGKRSGDGGGGSGLVSIVLPVYFNQENLESTFQEIHDDVIRSNPSYGFELIFVDDGSGDGSLKVLLGLKKRHPDLVKVIKFTRNFGQVNALVAGFAHAKGDYVVAMSADGQDPAALISDMLAAHGKGHDLVICTREGRDESLYRTLTSRFFYWLMRKLTFPNMPRGGFDYLSMSRRVVDVLMANAESHMFLQGQILWTGFEPEVIPYRRRKRTGGKSRWTLRKKITYLIDGVLSYSYAPLRLMSLLGLLFAFLGFCYAVLILAFRIFGNIPIKGWAPLMIVVLVLGGLQLLVTGIIGEYLWRTLSQSRDRDLYVIDRVYD